MRTVGDEATLTAPGVLELPVPVRALYDRGAAHEVTLRNLLAAKGSRSLDAVREEAARRGREEGREEGPRGGSDRGASDARGVHRGARVAARRGARAAHRGVS
nr:hypothetical protein [Deltaproteobacteria bacterium]